MNKNQRSLSLKLSRERCAFLAFLFGVICVFGVWACFYGAWTLWEFLPFLSFLPTIIFGIVGLKSQRKGLATLGILLAISALSFLIVIMF